MEHFDSLNVSAEEVRHLILAMRGVFGTSTTNVAFCMELQRLIRPDDFTSAAMEAQQRFYRYVRDLLRTKEVTADPDGIAHHTNLANKVIKTIWPLASSAISDSFKLVKRGKARDTNRPSLQDFMQHTPMGAATEDEEETLLPRPVPYNRHDLPHDSPSSGLRH